MLHTTDKIIKHKTGVLNPSEELGNVSKACQVMGMSRDRFYRSKLALEDGGVEALQADLDERLHHDNFERTHQGKICCGRTPIETMIDGKEIWRETFVK